MPWVRLDDHFDQNPKIAKIGPLGLALWVTGIAYCNRNLTDGFIPWGIARNLLSWEWLDISRAVDQAGGYVVATAAVSFGMHGEDVESDYVIGLLVKAGVWDDVDGGYLIHDYGDYQPSKAQVEAERMVKQAAGQAGGIASAKARAQRTSKHVLNGFATNGAAKSKPVPDPVPDPDPQEKNPPNPPLTRGEPLAVRAARARGGSRRTRDVIALETEPKDYQGSIDGMRERMAR